jgi:hypothetical protein
LSGKNNQLTICPHCKGSSLCQFSTLVWRDEILEENTRYYFLNCAKCGKGVEKEVDQEEDAEVGLNGGMMVFEEIAAVLAPGHPPQP